MVRSKSAGKRKAVVSPTRHSARIAQSMASPPHAGQTIPPVIIHSSSSDEDTSKFELKRRKTDAEMKEWLDKVAINVPADSEGDFVVDDPMTAMVLFNPIVCAARLKELAESTKKVQEEPVIEKVPEVQNPPSSAKKAGSSGLRRKYVPKRYYSRKSRVVNKSMSAGSSKKVVSEPVVAESNRRSSENEDVETDVVTPQVADSGENVSEKPVSPHAVDTGMQGENVSIAGLSKDLNEDEKSEGEKHSDAHFEGEHGADDKEPSYSDSSDELEVVQEGIPSSDSEPEPVQGKEPEDSDPEFVVSLREMMKRGSSSKKKGSRKSVGESSGVKDTAVEEWVDEIFVCKESKEFWESVKEKEMNGERNVDMDYLDELHLLSLLKETWLIGSATGNIPYDENVVKEFYCNLTVDCVTPGKKDFQEVYVRGTYYIFSPEMIADVLGCWNPDEKKLEKLSYDQIASCLTAGVRNVWKIKNDSPKVSELSPKYAALHKMAMSNWMPVTHTNNVSMKMGLLLYMVGNRVAFDLSKTVYEKVCYFDGQPHRYGLLVFPSTIYKLLLKQGFVEDPNAVLKNPPLLKLSSKPATGNRVQAVADVSDDDGEPAVARDVMGQPAGSARAVIEAEVAYLRKKELQLRSRRLSLQAFLDENDA